MKLKSIARDTDKLMSSIVIGTLTKEMRLTAFHCNELMKHLFYIKGECKGEGKTFCEIEDSAKSIIERHLSLEIKLLFPVAYNDYCAEIEANFVF